MTAPRIVIVEDERLIAIRITRRLTRLGYLRTPFSERELQATLEHALARHLPSYQRRAREAC